MRTQKIKVQGQKLLVTILTSNNIERLKRLLYIIDNKMFAAQNLYVEYNIVVNTLSDEYYEEVLALNSQHKVIRTESDGTAGKGKNSCHKIFLDSTADFLSQIDGDDMLYPTYLQSLADHIARAPYVDVLGIRPVDYITSDWFPDAGHVFEVAQGTHASVWGISLCKPGGDAGVAEHPLLWNATESCISQDKFILQSRRAAQINMTESMLQAEDHLQSFKYLAEHQKGNLTYYQTMSSDMYLVDRSTPDSIQKKYESFDYVSKLKEEVLKYVPKWRSSFYELPFLYIDLKLTHNQKEDWIKEFWKEFYN
jgi:hypothetical protein